jgi:hypothetical protein
MLKERLRYIHQLVGELSSQMSDIELGWYLLFTCLMHQTPREITDTIIKLHKTGEGQRQPIMAVASTVFPKDSDSLKFIGQLKCRTDSLAGRRNAAIHCIIHTAEWAIPRKIVAAGIAKRSPLADKDIVSELEDCLKEADVLASAINSFLDALDVRGQAPALEPPRLKAQWKNPLSDTPAK